MSIVLNCTARRLVYHFASSPVTGVIVGMFNNAPLIIFCNIFLLILVVPAQLKVYEDLYEGSECTLENGNKGICKKLPECPPRVAEVTAGKRDALSKGRCGFDKFIEIVCCPSADSPSVLGQRIAENACKEYRRTIYALPKRAFLFLLGGTEADRCEFPYMVSLGYKNTRGDSNINPIKYNCGGTLISPLYVLTAAHCVSNTNEALPVEVRLGDTSLTSSELTVQRIPVERVIPHPQYKRSRVYNDVAVIKLETEVKISRAAQPICLHTTSVNTNSMAKNTYLIAIGFGNTEPWGKPSNVLMKTPPLRTLSLQECNSKYTNFDKLPSGLDNTVICAMGINTTDVDTCQGDSGGPLLLVTPGGHTIVGITSFGQSCGVNAPGVYMSVHAFLDWIVEQVWQSNNKVR